MRTSEYKGRVVLIKHLELEDSFQFFAFGYFTHVLHLLVVYLKIVCLFCDVEIFANIIDLALGIIERDSEIFKRDSFLSLLIWEYYLELC